ncbi:hypothetical protein ACUXCC_004586 [Cytobacillus horneckiae]
MIGLTQKVQAQKPIKLTQKTEEAKKGFINAAVME